MKERTALYRLYDAEDRLLYVGITTDTAVRWQAHSTNKWWPDVARRDVCWYNTRAEAEEVEKVAIKSEQPLYNRAHADYHPPLGTSTRELRANFADIINTVATSQQPVFITSHKRRIAAIVPVSVAEAIEQRRSSDS